MELIASKVFSIVCLGLGTLFVGLLPVFFAKRGRKQWPLFLSCLLCFGGGVLLSTSLIHMLPEVREAMPDTTYSEIIYCGGFFILYIIDELVHFCYGDVDEMRLHEHSENHSQVDDARRHSVGLTYSVHNRPSYGSSERTPLVSDRGQYWREPTIYKARSDSELLLEGRAPSQLCHVGHQEPCEASLPTTNIGLLVALSIHALIEGLIVGLEKVPSKVLLLLGAICSHKLVVGFCLGIEIASNATNTICRHFLCILIFTIGSVAGIIAGMIISDIPTSVTSVAIPVLQALAGGTLLYVAVSEIIPRERARWHQEHSRKAAGIYQFFSVAIGFCVMTVFSKYLEA